MRIADDFKRKYNPLSQKMQNLFRKVFPGKTFSCGNVYEADPPGDEADPPGPPGDEANTPGDKVDPPGDEADTPGPPGDEADTPGVEADQREEAKYFCCENCSIKFTLKRNLSRHIREACKLSANTLCEVCGLQFKSMQQSTNHKKTHLVSKF